ncbi:MAG: ABC transporter permease [Planctomycetota bacterium]|nr:MAG: ABC transporter permease [Planctomycetota bacterium]
MTAVILGLILGALAGATPLIFAALGGLCSERAGVINLALEGFMLVGAFGAVLVTYVTGSPLAGLIGAVIAAAVFALVYAFLCLDLRADQIVAGIVMNLLAAGICAFLVKRIWNISQNSPPVEKLFSIPIAFGDFRREISILVPVAFVAVIVVWFILRRTVFGLNLRAAGEDPSALVATGVSPRRVRYFALLCSGILCGLGGAFLSIGYLNQFMTTITHGRGFIAIAALIMGNWRPVRTAAACLLIGAAYEAGYALTGFGVPEEVWRMLPYVLTIVVLCVFNIAVRPPRALGRF